MNEIIKVNSQFNGITAQEFYNSPADDCRVVCLSSRQVTIIRKALLSMVWRTRFGEYIEPNLWRILDNTELVELVEETEVNLMANCFDDAATIIGEAVVTASENLAFAISAINCGGGINVNCGSGGRSGSGGAGGSSPPYSTETPIVPGIGDPPEGYASWEEFNNDKCAIASYLVNTLIDDIGRASTINFELQTLVTLAVILAPLLLDPIPGDEIIVLCGILIAIHEQAETILSNMQSVMDDGKADLICEFYNASTPAAAEQAFEAKWSELWYASPYVNILYDWAALQSVNTMVTSEMTNKLFEKQSDKRYTEADCAGCVIEWELYTPQTVVQLTENSWRMTPIESGDCAPVGQLYTCSAGRVSGGNMVQGSWTIDLESGSINNVNSGDPNSCNYSWRGINCGSTEVWSHQATPPSFPIVMDSFTIRSNVPFSIVITIDNEGEVTCE